MYNSKKMATGKSIEYNMGMGMGYGYLFKVANVGSGCPISRARGSCYKRATI